MDLTKSRHPDSMVLGSVKIELSREGIEIDHAKKTYDIKGLEDLGLARGVKISFSSSKIDVKADNGTVPLKGQTDMKAKVEFSLLERYLPLMGKIMAGLVTVKPIPAAKKTVEETKAANFLVKDKLYSFNKQNYNLAKPENLVVKQGSKILAQDSDYKIEQAANSLWGIKFPQASTIDLTKPTLISYEVAGVKSYRLSKGSGGVVAPISLRLTNRRKAEDGSIIGRIYDFPYGFYDGEDSVTFKSKNDSDNVAEVPISFEFSPHPDLALDNEFEDDCLYAEEAEETEK